MAATTQKPLPAIPEAPVTSPYAVLTIEARAHLSKFIRHILAEDEQTSILDPQRDAWARVLEGALDELSESISKGDCLSRLKRARELMDSRRDSVKASQGTEADKSSLASANGSKRRGHSVDDKHSEHTGDSHLASTHSTKSAGSADRTLALDQLRILLSQPASDSAAESSNHPASHLLLSVAAFKIASARDDNGVHVIAANPGCTFEAGKFILPSANTDESVGDGVVLFGIDEWDGQHPHWSLPSFSLLTLASRPGDTFSSGEHIINLVGGSFYLNGVNSSAQYLVLLKVLRVVTYFHLSLLLEQHFLANSNVELHFSAPSPPSEPVQPISPPVEIVPSPLSQKSKNRHSSVTSGILSLLSKTGSLVHRAASIRPPRRRSLDLVPGSIHGQQQGAARLEERLPRFSFNSGRRSSVSKLRQEKHDPEPPLLSALKHIEQSGEFLSTSIDVTFKPPSLLVSLAEKETKGPSLFLKGDEKAGLASILGWEGRHARGLGMYGTPGFVRHQTFSVLHSSHVCHEQPTQPTPTSETPPTPHASTTPTFSICDVPRWITFRCYSRAAGADRSLGDTVTHLCSNSNKPCDTPGCTFKRGQHERRFIHGGLMVAATLSPCQPESPDDSNDLKIWQSCKVCGAKTEPSQMSDGT